MAVTASMRRTVSSGTDTAEMANTSGRDRPADDGADHQQAQARAA